MRRRTPALATVAAAALLLVPAAAARSAQGPDPDAPAKPTARQLERSITVFDPGGTVLQYTLEGTVEPLKQESTSGGRTTVTISSDVLFAFGSADLTATARREIDAVAARVPRGGAAAVDGYTDAIGAPAANLALSRRRAAAVAARIAQTRPDVRSRVTGHGEADPVAPNTRGGKDDPEGRAKNRRVTIGFGS